MVIRSGFEPDAPENVKLCRPVHPVLLAEFVDFAEARHPGANCVRLALDQCAAFKGEPGDTLTAP